MGSFFVIAVSDFSMFNVAFGAATCAAPGKVLPNAVGFIETKRWKRRVKCRSHFEVLLSGGVVVRYAFMMVNGFNVSHPTRRIAT